MKKAVSRVVWGVAPFTHWGFKAWSFMIIRILLRYLGGYETKFFVYQQILKYINGAVKLST